MSGQASRPDSLPSGLFNKKTAFRGFLLTHLGSNQDSAEPKSDVLPITPWVNNLSIDAAKLKKNSIAVTSTA
jgi:hypothetical protein